MPSSPRIVIVGAGVIGCAVAFELASRGASVYVVDQREPGMGATQASAGVLAPFIEAREGGPLLELTAQSLELYDEFVERVVAASGLAVPYRRAGTLDAALEESSLPHLEAIARVLRARGLEAELLDSEDVRRCERHLSTDVVGGLLIPTHGFVAATELSCALVSAAERTGATFEAQTRVSRVSHEDDSVTVHADATSYRADAAVLAVGSWAGQIVVDGVDSPVPVKPIRGQLLRLAWQGPALQRTLWSERCYMVPWQDGTVLVGATVEDAGFDERTTIAGVRDLIDAACELVPHTWTESLTSTRVGLRPATPDGLPIIGWSTAQPHLMYATGHYRNGVLLAPLTAKIVADAVLGETTNPMLELTNPARFGAV